MFFFSGQLEIGLTYSTRALSFLKCSFKYRTRCAVGQGLSIFKEYGLVSFQAIGLCIYLRHSYCMRNVNIKQLVTSVFRCSPHTHMGEKYIRKSCTGTKWYCCIMFRYIPNAVSDHFIRKIGTSYNCQIFIPLCIFFE